MGTRPPSPQRGGASNFRPTSILAKWLHGSRCNWYGGRPLHTRHCVRWGPSSPPLKGHSPPQFSANVDCGQTAGWTKMPLGMEVGLGRGDFVFDGDPATSRKNGTPPHQIFCLCLLWPNGWMDEDAAWYGSRPQPRPHCISPSSPRKGHNSPLFSVHVYCGHGRPSQLLLSSCQHSFTVALSVKFAINSSDKMRSRLGRVATLPCEISGVF